jgi:hypothetical protein
VVKQVDTCARCLRIPAHHEQPFRSKVNTDSDRW